MTPGIGDRNGGLVVTGVFSVVIFDLCNNLGCVTVVRDIISTNFELIWLIQFGNSDGKVKPYRLESGHLIFFPGT